ARPVPYTTLFRSDERCRCENASPTKLGSVPGHRTFKLCPGLRPDVSTPLIFPHFVHFRTIAFTDELDCTVQKKKARRALAPVVAREAFFCGTHSQRR